MSQFPRYESYNDSGVQWLGEIPSHWAMKKLKYLTTYFKGFAFKSEDFSDIGIPLIKASNIKRFSIEKIDTYIALDKIQSSFDRVKLQEGDLILSTVGSLPNVLNSAVGQIAYIENSFNNSYLNQNNVCFRCNDLVVHAFLKYFVMSSFFRRSLDSHALWIANQAYLEIIDIQNINVAFPPINEQKIIANFLDKRLGQIDELIVKQEELLKKLAEQRIALISHAVTKGLDPNVEMKDSGVEWLGKVPKHWSVTRLKFLLSDKLKYGANESAESEDRSNPRYIRITDIDDSGSLKEDTFKSLESEKAEEYLLNNLDILLARSGATVGKSYMYQSTLVGKACYAGYLIRARLAQKQCSPEFISFFLQTKNYWDWIDSINIQSTIQNVSAEKYNDLALAIPSLVAQKEIVLYLKIEDEKFSQALNKGNKLIQVLQEYRSTLITHVVTGKIDVRNIDVN